MTIRIEDDPRGIRTVLLDRASKRNALNAGMVGSMSAALNGAPGPVVILASSDSRTFSSGADLDLGDDERARVSDSLYALYGQMRATDKIIVAAASGHAVGGGAQLLLASDIRIAAPDLTIRFVGPAHGLAVGAWGLPSLVGRGRALDLCLSMRSVPAPEALAMGLVDRLADDPIGTAEAYASEICELDLHAVAALKRIVGLSQAEGALSAERSFNSSWDGSVRRETGR